jgi:hypothetical protein
MQLPFLKESKKPRVSRPPMEEKSYGLDADEELEEHCIGELFDCAEKGDVQNFRKALEVLIRESLQMGEHDATDGIQLEESV